LGRLTSTLREVGRFSWYDSLVFLTNAVDFKIVTKPPQIPVYSRV
jgi:hypothetical protein